MQRDAKQTYISPEFIGAEVRLESGLCSNSVNEYGSDVVKEGNVRANIADQGGWDENASSGYIDNSWENANN